MQPREQLLSRTFVELADSLVDEFDVIEVLTVLADRCVALLDAAAAAILLADERNRLHVMAASSEQARLLELFQLQNHEGPCLDCFLSGRASVNQDLAASAQWPRFGAEARAAGFVSVQALPMRLRDQVIGALNVFMDDRVVIADGDLAVAQALADVATIAILQNQASRESQAVVAQLQTALNSRIAIEQAKGILAERAHLDMDRAFSRIRRYARNHNRRLSEVARALVEGQLSADAIAHLTRADEASLFEGPTPPGEEMPAEPRPSEEEEKAGAGGAGQSAGDAPEGDRIRAKGRQENPRRPKGSDDREADEGQRP